MCCERPEELLCRYLDGELPPPEALEVGMHLHTCAWCQQQAARHHHLQQELQSAFAEEEVPTDFLEHLRHRLRQEPPQAVPSDSQSRAQTRWRLWSSLAAVAALLLAAVGIQLWHPYAVALVVREVVDSQIRGQVMESSYSPMAAQPREIRHWFQDKVDFAVLVPELPQERYTFVGTRVNYFLGRRVAELAYTTDTHTLSFVMFPHHDLDLTAVPSTHLGTRRVHLQRYKGYSTVLWQDGEVLCGFVSDLALPALLQIAREVTGHLSAS